MRVVHLPETKGRDVRVVAVVVSYNRRDLLLECLGALRAQSRPLDAVVVIDNASHDDSAAAVSAKFAEVHLLPLPVNVGGAGGFSVGIAQAIDSHSADLVWVMDDDTIPTSTALERMLDARSGTRETPALLASRVVWTDGLDHPMNTPRSKPFAGTGERRDATATNSVPIRSASFVSMLVDAKTVKEEGLPVAEYFIWNDDFEFTSRVLRTRRGLFVPASVVVHKTRARTDTDADPGNRFYFEVRNKVWLFRASRALRWYERPLYVGATVRRWLRTFWRSEDRATLKRTLFAGLRDGFSRLPRTNSDYLASLGLDASVTATFERAHG
jgi:GT2 family glycosyltransferase